MMPSRIQAISRIHLAAPDTVTKEMIWFYTQVGALEQIAANERDSGVYGFRSGLLEVLVTPTVNARSDTFFRRLTLLVPSLSETMERLDERHMPYVKLSGTMSSDRRVAARDPVGHWVHFKQESPLL